MDLFNKKVYLIWFKNKESKTKELRGVFLNKKKLLNTLLNIVQDLKTQTEKASNYYIRWKDMDVYFKNVMDDLISTENHIKSLYKTKDKEINCVIKLANISIPWITSFKYIEVKTINKDEYIV